ncbi:unnamed protein product, partial [Symbiodinium sp. KB8]
GTGLGGSGGFQLAALPGFAPAAVGCRGGVMARVVKSMPPTGGGSGGVLGPGTSGGGVSGTSSVALGGHGVSGVVCGVSGGLVGMAGGCTVGGRLGGYLSLGAAGGVGGALLGSCGAWTSRTAVLGFELLGLVLGPKETGGPVGALGTAAAPSACWAVVPPSGLEQRWSLDWQQLLGEGEHRCWEWWVLDWNREGVAANGQGKTGPLALGGLGGDTGDSTGGLAGVVGVPGLVPGFMGTSKASEPVGAGSWGSRSTGCARSLGWWQPPSHCPWLQRAASKTVVVLATKLVVDVISGVSGFI